MWTGSLLSRVAKVLEIQKSELMQLVELESIYDFKDITLCLVSCVMLLQEADQCC